MFGTIRKHQNWLWAVIITITIISFVVFFSPYSKMNQGSRRGSGGYGSINGQPITDDQYRRAYRETDLHTFFMSGGHWMREDKKRSESDTEREVYQWLLLVQKQGELGIHVDNEAAAEMARQMMRSLERAGVSSPQIFIQKILEPNGLSLEDFERYTRHFVGIQELINTIGLTGRLITPQETKALYEREHQEVLTSAVLFNHSNYLANVTVPPEMLSQFYSNRLSNYAIAERVSVSYLRFNVSNYLAAAESDLGTNISERVDENYQRLGTNIATLFPDAKTPEEGKKMIREQLIRQQALMEARKKATDFANALFDIKPAQPGNLQQLAASNGLEVAVSEPFDRDSGPKTIEAGADFTKAAFMLTSDEPFGGPIPGQDGFYVIAQNKVLPREIPPLDQIRERVTFDYKRTQAMAMARQAASGFFLAVSNGLSSGKAFSNLCAEASVKSLDLSPFSISSKSIPETEDWISPNQLKQAAFSTSPGKCSAPVSISDGSIVVYVKSKLPVDPAKMQTDLPTFAATVRRSRQQEAFDEWFRREAEKGLRDTPVGRPRPATMDSSSKS